ncbi:MAG: sugar ABC transporter permease [Nitrososphaerota archaeon]
MMGKKKPRISLPIFLQLPATIIIWSLVAFVLPWLIYASFHSSIPGKGFVFVGLNNYFKLFSDKRVYESLLRTAYYSGAGATTEVFLGMIIALALVNAIKNEKVRFGVLLLFLIPMMFSEAIVANMWLLLVNPAGYINSLLRTFNLPRINWLGTEMALTTIMIADIWQWTSLPLLLIYASRSSIPKEFYEYANLERLSSWQTFRVVTWPHIKSAVAVSFLLRLIFMNIYIDKIIVLTYGGPGFASEILGFYIYLQSFQYGASGYSATLSLITLIIIGVLTYVFWKFMRLGRV